jgi:Aspartyl/Asparaginyl beta-hydroxylase
VGGVASASDITAVKDWHRIAMVETDGSPVRYRRLALDFSAQALARDLAGIDASDWVAHFNTGYHDGGWSGVTLRGIGADARQLFPGDSQTTSYTDTPLRARCPNIDAALGRLSCPVGPVRLLRLSAGGQIREHRDAGLCLEQGLARLHVPIVTGDAVEFYLDGDLVTMAPGECWYLNFDLPHRVQNLGTADRVHLVIDCATNEWLLGQIFAGSTGAPQRDSSQGRFAQFRELVLDQPDLVAALWPIEQPDVFIERVVELGQHHGFRFTAQEVEAALRMGRRVAVGRWIVE